MTAIIIGKISQDPDSRMVHLDDCRNAFSCAQPEHRHAHRIRHGIPVQSHDQEGMPRQREAANFGGAAIQYVKQNSFAMLHTDRFTMAQHSAVDCERAIADFVSMGHTLGKRSLHR